MCRQQRERERESMCVYVKLSKATKINKKVSCSHHIYFYFKRYGISPFYSIQNILRLSVNTLILSALESYDTYQAVMHFHITSFS